MKNPKIVLLTILVIILAVLNVIAISTIWFRMPKSGPRHQPPFVMLEKGLQMTDEQRDDYKELRKAHRQMMEETRHKAAEIRRQLHHFANPQSDSIVRLLTDSLGRLHGNMERNTYEHFYKVRQMCTPEQQEKFDLIIPEILKRIGGPPAHGPGGRRGHRPPGNR